jgi:hypothetical protein
MLSDFLAWYVPWVTGLAFDLGHVLPCNDLIATYGGVCFA